MEIVIISTMMERNNNSQTNRIVALDFLRVLASFAVIVLHVSAKNWYYTDVNGFEWQVFNFFDSIVRWSVPAFIMISGCVFLGKEIPIKKLYSKYIIRLAVSFMVWSLIYSVIDGTVITKPTKIIEGHYHMWFILMIMVVYVCIPLLHELSVSSPRTRYFLMFSFVFAFLIPETIMLLKDFGSSSVISWTDAFSRNFQKMDIQVFLGYISYFVLGYFFSSIEIRKKQRIIIYILGIFGFIFTILVDLIVALKTQTMCGHYYNYFSVNVFCESMAVFIWFKNRQFKQGRLSWFVQKMAKYSFGAYLVHALVMEQLDLRFGINSLSFNPVLAVILVSVLVFSISYTISALLNQIPIVKKYLV